MNIVIKKQKIKKIEKYRNKSCPQKTKKQAKVCVALEARGPQTLTLVLECACRTTVHTWVKPLSCLFCGRLLPSAVDEFMVPSIMFE